MSGFLLVCLASCITCQPLVLFSSGVLIIVFWMLTCLQCPIPCAQYRGQKHGQKNKNCINKTKYFKLSEQLSNALNQLNY